MSDEFDDGPELDEDFEDELDEDSLEEGEDLDDEFGDLDDDLDEGSTMVEDDEDDDEEAEAPAATEDDEEIIDLDEELHPDDVEEALDVVLRERTAKAGLEDEEDDDEPDDRGEGGNKIVPRRPNEFVCSSCFLVHPRHMLADEGRQLCSDCV